MNLQSIIEELANQADDLLADSRNRKEAQLALAEALTARYPKLTGVDRQKIITTVLGILDEEGFFESSSKGDSWSDAADEEESE